MRFAGQPLRRWIAAGAAACVVAALYLAVAQPGKGARLTDFTCCYYAAGAAMIRGDAAALVPLMQSARFVNLPIIAWVFAPLTWLGPMASKLVFTGVGAAAVGASLVILARRARPSARPLIFLLFAVNGPLWYSLMIGNTSEFVLLLLVLGFCCLERQRMWSAGLLIGVAAVIKPMLLLFGVYFAWRGNWRAVLGGGAVVAGVVALSVALFGVDYNLDWYRYTVVAFGGHPSGAASNQSLEAFLLRLWTGPALRYDVFPHAMPEGARIAWDALLGLMAAATALALYRGRNAGRAAGAQRDALEFSLILVLCLIVSPISWTHYYANLLLVFALYADARLPVARDRATRSLMIAGIVLCSLPFRILSGTGTLDAITSRSIESAWLIGGVVLLAALLRSAIGRGGRVVHRTAGAAPGWVTPRHAGEAEPAGGFSDGD